MAKGEKHSMQISSSLELTHVVKMRRRKAPKMLTGYLFVAPAILYLLMFSIYPVLSTIRLSFTDVTAGVWREVGLQNYSALIQDPWFFNSFENTLIFTLASTALHLLLGLAFALLLNERWFSILFRNFMRGALFLPYIFSTAATALMWSLLFHPIGLFNFLQMSVIKPPVPIDFLGTPGLAMLGLIAVNTWKAYPFYMIGILGGLQSIPPELYEAAKVDGAGIFGRFRHITIPLLRTVLVPIATIDIITTFGHVDFIKLLTRGGPLRTTETVAYYIYKVSMLDGRQSYGAAISTLTLIILSVVAFTYLRALSKGGETGETSF
jgi:multiple sugar transport system permease protein